ncbi:Peptidyl-prolyl cis-trans isomerase FKBP16-4, chloroplastic [Porphyridium purpureum]|uniref:peptidylprolyl isomerase n=1 Tax=Porphyridium purpureum TaxID=35688 RepID=A0A5J4YNQ5_PORPP|nr:Peptidyl-prolyl cis-trans isomerase FKBP16-4, chloroplastic [Porphyridium purpureum]|eukprot:POR5189..scf222_8
MCRRGLVFLGEQQGLRYECVTPRKLAMSAFVANGAAPPGRRRCKAFANRCETCASERSPMKMGLDGDEMAARRGAEIHAEPELARAEAVVSRRTALAQALAVGSAMSSLALVPLPAYALSKRRLKFKTDWLPAEKVPESGVRFREITVGSGIEPRDGDQVAIHFSLFYNDLEVESSRESQGLAASPYGFTFGRSSGPGSTVPGINIGMAGMKVGGLRLIEIPANYAFGKRGKKPMIPPDATVEYAVQLLSCKRSGTNTNVSGIGSSMF